MNAVAEKKMEATWQPYAECIEDDCGWEHPTAVRARDAGKAHVKWTGHRVRIVVERVAIWGPK